MYACMDGQDEGYVCMDVCVLSNVCIDRLEGSMCRELRAMALQKLSGKAYKELVERIQVC